MRDDDPLALLKAARTAQHYAMFEAALARQIFGSPEQDAADVRDIAARESRPRYCRVRRFGIEEDA